MVSQSLSVLTMAPEFIATHLQDWLKKIGIKPMQIYPGSPWENGYNERFNGTLRKKSSTLNGSTPHLMVVKKASMMGGVF